MGWNCLIVNNFYLLIDVDISDVYCKIICVENELKLKWCFYYGCIDECFILKFIDMLNLILFDGLVLFL